MKMINLVAIKETLELKKHGLVTYETDTIVNQPGIILLNNPEGVYGMAIINQVHEGGDKPVRVAMRPVSAPVRKYEVGDVVAVLAVFE